MDLFRHKNLTNITDKTFEHKKNFSRLLLSHISHEHYEQRNPGDPPGPRNYSYNKHDSLLHIAASLGRLDIYQELLKFSYQRNPPAEDGRTPLHHACKNGHLDIVQFLLPTLMDKSPRTDHGKNRKKNPESLERYRKRFT